MELKPLALILLASVGLLAQEVTPPPGGGGGGGGVTSVATGCGLTGGTISTTGTISQAIATTAHNGSYAILTGDCGKSLTTNTAAAWTIAQAGTTGFEAGKFWGVQNVGSGSLTLTATTSTFYGGPTANISGSVLTVPANTGVTVVSDGANYQILAGGSGGGGGTVTVQGGGNLTSTAIMTGAGAQVSQTPSSNATVDLNGNLTVLSVTTNDASHSSAQSFKGVTSGGQALGVADIAGTLIGYVLPVTNGTAGQVMVDTGATTCPTWAAAFSTFTPCHALVWRTRYGSCIVASMDTQSTAVLTAAQFTGGGCTVPQAATLVEVDVWGKTVSGLPGTYGGASAINVTRTRPNGTGTQVLLSGALASNGSATNQNMACALSATGGTCINGLTSSVTISISNSALNAGDTLDLSAIMADGAQVAFYVVAIWTY